jgi:hypothetical protein
MQFSRESLAKFMRNLRLGNVEYCGVSSQAALRDTLAAKMRRLSHLV